MKLLPCPFCSKDSLGISAYYVETDEGEIDGHAVACLSCGVRGPVKPTGRKAVNAWNKRCYTNNSLAFGE